MGVVKILWIVFLLYYITYSFISVRQTQLLLCYNYLKDRVSVSYDYMFRSFFDHPQVYKSYNLYILAV
jgi:hypothetical protein